jgi:hypothetical protein
MGRCSLFVSGFRFQVSGFRFQQKANHRTQRYTKKIAFCCAFLVNDPVLPTAHHKTENGVLRTVYGVPGTEYWLLHLMLSRVSFSRDHLELHIFTLLVFDF